MTQNVIQIRVIEPSQGMILTNGQTYSFQVYLGSADSPDNWHEVRLDQVPQVLRQQYGIVINQ